MRKGLRYEKFTKDIMELSLIYLFFEKSPVLDPKSTKKCVVWENARFFGKKNWQNISSG